MTSRASAHRLRHGAGYAYDPALPDDELGRQDLPGARGELIGTRDLGEVVGPIDVAILFDVLEHVPDRRRP